MRNLALWEGLSRVFWPPFSAVRIASSPSTLIPWFAKEHRWPVARLARWDSEPYLGIAPLLVGMDLPPAGRGSFPGRIDARTAVMLLQPVIFVRRTVVTALPPTRRYAPEEPCEGPSRVGLLLPGGTG